MSDDTKKTNGVSVTFAIAKQKAIEKRRFKPRSILKARSVSDQGLDESPPLFAPVAAPRQRAVSVATCVHFDEGNLAATQSGKDADNDDGFMIIDSLLGDSCDDFGDLFKRHRSDSYKKLKAGIRDLSFDSAKQHMKDMEDKPGNIRKLAPRSSSGSIDSSDSNSTDLQNEQELMQDLENERAKLEREFERLLSKKDLDQLTERVENLSTKVERFSLEEEYDDDVIDIENINYLERLEERGLLDDLSLFAIECIPGIELTELKMKYVDDLKGRCTEEVNIAVGKYNELRNQLESMQEIIESKEVSENDKEQLLSDLTVMQHLYDGSHYKLGLVQQQLRDKFRSLNKHVKLLTANLKWVLPEIFGGDYHD